jgi:prefoldin alpha subunit
MNMNDDELRQAMAVLESYKAQLEAMTQQTQYLRLSLDECVRSRDTLKAFSQAKEGDDVLVPLGASSYVSAKATASRNAVIGIGSNVSIDMDIDEAAKFMDESVTEIKEALGKITSSMQEMDGKAQNLAAAIQQEYQRRQQ